MKKSRFTETQIVSILKEVDAGMKVEEICRKHGISNAMNRHQFARHLSAIQNGYQRGAYEQQEIYGRVQDRSSPADS